MKRRRIGTGIADPPRRSPETLDRSPKTPDATSSRFYEEQEEPLPAEVAKLYLSITLDNLTTSEEAPKERRLEARRVAQATANKKVLSRRRDAAAAAAAAE